MNGTHFIAAAIAWASLLLLDNRFDYDWRAYGCFHCGDWAAGLSTVSLVALGLGAGVPVLYAVFFFANHVGKFLAFLVLAVFAVFGLLYVIVSGGGSMLGNHGLMHAVLLFVIAMTMAAVTSVRTGPRRRRS